MAKEKRFAMGSLVYDMAKKPLRQREDFILLLLYTLRSISVNEYLRDDKGEVLLYISKMNRLFYRLDEKIFSIQFPFCVEFDSSEKNISIYDKTNGIKMDSRINSILISFFETHSMKEGTFEEFFDGIMDCAKDLEIVTPEQIWNIIKQISTYDLGYLRYDYDIVHENGNMHPINHLDISYESAATYKIGLHKTINYADLKDILDLTTPCKYLEK